METFPALLALCAGNSPITGKLTAQSPLMRSFDVFFDLRLDKRMSKQSWVSWFETPSCPLWRHCNVVVIYRVTKTMLYNISVCKQRICQCKFGKSVDISIVILLFSGPNHGKRSLWPILKEMRFAHLEIWSLLLFITTCRLLSFNYYLNQCYIATQKTRDILKADFIEMIWVGF